MFILIAEKITTHLEENKTIKSEDRLIYRYGIQQGLSILLNLITTLLVGVVSGMLGESIIFSAAYMLLRRYAGGFHAKTPVRCYVYSTTMIIVVLLAIKLLPLVKVIYFCLVVVGSVGIFLFAPVEDKHKPLDATEKHVYRKRTLLVLCVEIMFFVLGNALKVEIICHSITMAIITISILVLLGKMKNN